MSEAGGILTVADALSEREVLAISGHIVHDSPLERFFELTKSLFPCWA